MEQVLAGVPATLLRDVDGGNVVSLGVDSVYCLYGRQNRNLVLDRTATKNNSYIDFALQFLYKFFVSDYLNESGRSFS